MLQFESLSDNCNISHFITTRHGGVSEGNYASFNLGAYCGERQVAVHENRRRLCEALCIQTSDLYVPYQTHGDEIRILDDDFLSANYEKKLTALNGVDALLTDRLGICIAVTTADCVPIVLYAKDKHVVGVVHAGWRGTVQNIAKKTVEMMNNVFAVAPTEVVVGIAPAISQENYEVGQELVEAFIASGSDLTKICRTNQISGKPHIDLIEANRLQLIAAGVLDERIEVSGICTYTSSSSFYSARKLGVESGRFLTGIMLNK